MAAGLTRMEASLIRSSHRKQANYFLISKEEMKTEQTTNQCSIYGTDKNEHLYGINI